MNREQAELLVLSRLSEPHMIRHSYSVAVVMEELARRQEGRDADLWYLTGLLHDLDYELTADKPERHGHITLEMLSGENFAPEGRQAILAHAHPEHAETELDWGLLAADPTTGFITAVALMHPSRSLDACESKRMLKRFREKAFAKGADREQMSLCTRLGLDLPAFLELSVRAMRGIRERLDL